MKTLDNFTSKLDNLEMNILRGGTGGGSMPIDEDILLPDPEPGEPCPYE